LGVVKTGGGVADKRTEATVDLQVGGRERRSGVSSSEQKNRGVMRSGGVRRGCKTNSVTGKKEKSSLREISVKHLSKKYGDLAQQTLGKGILRGGLP